MEQLGELEKRVLKVIQKNKELQNESNKFKTENVALKEQCKQLEASLMKESSSSKGLEKEKASIKTTIEELLNTINTLQQSK